MVHLALRISAELNERVEKCAHELRQKKHSLAQAAVEAAVEAIERNEYQLVVPIKFDVASVPSPARPQPLSSDLRAVEREAVRAVKKIARGDDPPEGRP